jgi:predicted ABC-class ATPase
MQELIAGDREPITPYIARIRELYEHHGISSVIVVGGVGDYLDVADTVLLMDEYRAVDATERAHAIAAATPRDARALRVDPSPHLPPVPRVLDRRSLDPRRGRRDKVGARGTRSIQFGTQDIDIGFVEQVVDPAQARYIGDCLLCLARGEAPDAASIREACEALDRLATEQGLTALDDFHGGAGDRAHARPFEVAAALDRLRTLHTTRS